MDKIIFVHIVVCFVSSASQPTICNNCNNEEKFSTVEGNVGYGRIINVMEQLFEKISVIERTVKGNSETIIDLNNKISTIQSNQLALMSRVDTVRDEVSVMGGLYDEVRSIDKGLANHANAIRNILGSLNSTEGQVLSNGYGIEKLIDNVKTIEAIEAKIDRVSSCDGNLAFGKPAHQSSTFVWVHISRLPMVAGLAVDGNPDPLFHSGSQEASCSSTLLGSANPWWSVDLENSYRIQKVTITARADCCNQHLHDVYVGVTDVSPVSQTPSVSNVRPCAFYEGPFGAGETRSLYCDSNTVVGRYVVVQMTGEARPLMLCEVQVFGNIFVE